MVGVHTCFFSPLADGELKPTEECLDRNFLVKILPGVLVCESEANQLVMGKYRKAVKGVLLKEGELLSL